MRSLELCWGTLGPTKNTGIFFILCGQLDTFWSLLGPIECHLETIFGKKKRPKSEPYMAQHSPQNGSRYSQKGLGMAPIRLPWRSLSALWWFCWAKNRSKSEPYTKGSDFWHFSSRKWFPETSMELYTKTNNTWKSMKKSYTTKINQVQPHWYCIYVQCRPHHHGVQIVGCLEIVRLLLVAHQKTKNKKIHTMFCKISIYL